MPFSAVKRCGAGEADGRRSVCGQRQTSTLPGAAAEPRQGPSHAPREGGAPPFAPAAARARLPRHHLGDGVERRVELRHAEPAHAPRLVRGALPGRARAEGMLEVGVAAQEERRLRERGERGVFVGGALGGAEGCGEGRVRWRAWPWWWRRTPADMARSSASSQGSATRGTNPASCEPKRRKRK